MKLFLVRTESSDFMYMLKLLRARRLNINIFSVMSAFVFSVVFFIALFQAIGLLKHQVSYSGDSALINVDENDKSLYEINKFIECASKKRDWEHINKEIDCFTGESVSYKFIDIFKSQIGTDYLFDIIYFLLFLCLLVQSWLFFYVVYSGRTLESKYFYISDWAINSSPLLGVLGTIASFSALVSNSQHEEISEIFSKYFFLAAITTLVGGFIYTTNLMLAYKINQHIEE
jgi:hypothetical protein